MERLGGGSFDMVAMLEMVLLMVFVVLAVWGSAGRTSTGLALRDPNRVRGQISRIDSTRQTTAAVARRGDDVQPFVVENPGMTAAYSSACECA
jgi:hypothetical protein